MIQPGAPTGDSPAPSGPDIHGASRAVQRSMLPASAPSVEGWDLAGGTITAEEGRGHTVWDWFTLGGGPVLAALEVRKSGLPASHFLGAARVALRSAARHADGVADLLTRANAVAGDVHPPGVDQFVECGVLQPTSDGVSWACSGTMPAAVLRREGTFEALRSHGPSLGLVPTFRFEGTTVEMGPGDSILVLSGGSQGIFRGAADLVAQVHGKPAGEVVTTIQKAIRRAQGDEAPELSTLYLRKH